MAVGVGVNLGFIEQGWRKLMQLLGGPEHWTLAGRASANDVVVRAMRADRGVR